MSQPYFSNNPSDWTQLEGLYINELAPVASAQGVNLNTIAIAGKTIRGPIGVAVLIGSPQRFFDVFGGRDYGSGGAIANDVWKALNNKRFGAFYVIRAAAAAATTASRSFVATATPIISVAASSPGLWGANLTVAITAATSGVSTQFNMEVNYLGKKTVYQDLDVNGTNDNLLAKIGDDYSNLVVVTKLANGRPDNIAATALTTIAGTDGSIADTDYTGTGKALEVAANTPGCAAVLCAERMSATIKAKLYALAGLATDRVFLMAPDAANTAAATANTEAASYRHDRVIYCFNHPKQYDFSTGTKIDSGPDSVMASIISQTDVNQHVGSFPTAAMNTGLVDLNFPALTRADYIAFKAAGVSALIRDDAGIVFQSGVTTSLTSLKTEIARRRSADFLQLSIARAINPYVKSENNASNRATSTAVIDAFLADLKANQRIVESYSIDGETANTPSQRANGLEIKIVKVKLIGHMLSIVLQTDMSTGTVTVVQ